MRALTPERVYLACALVFGLLVLGANPPFQAADEYEHLFRAMQLSEGRLLGERDGPTAGGILPEPINRIAYPGELAGKPERRATRAYFRQKLDPLFCDWGEAQRIFLNFPHTVIYPPGGYLPQIVGVTIGKLLHIGPLGLMYLTRLFVLGTSIALGLAAIRRLSTFRWTMVLVLLSPMSLYLMTSASQDAVLIGCAMLLAAMSWRIATDNARQIGWREQTVLLLLSCVLGTAKFVYLPLAASVPLIVLPRLPSRANRVWFGLLWLLVCPIAAWLWMRAANSLFVPGRHDVSIDPAAQAGFIVQHPTTFLAVLVDSIRSQALFLYRSMVGLLGWNDTFVPVWYCWVFATGLLTCWVAESQAAEPVKWLVRVGLLGASATAALLIFVALYLTWNPPGSRNLIEGPTGRYFLPIVPFVLLGLSRISRLAISTEATTLVGTAFGIVGAIVCVWIVATRYYAF